MAYKEIKVSDKEAVQLNEYVGRFSLNAMTEGKGKYYIQWAKYAKFKDEFQEKSWPVKVNLGDKAQAIAVLKRLIAQIEGKEEQDEVLF